MFLVIWQHHSLKLSEEQEFVCSFMILFLESQQTAKLATPDSDNHEYV